MLYVRTGRPSRPRKSESEILKTNISFVVSKPYYAMLCDYSEMSGLSIGTLCRVAMTEELRKNETKIIEWRKSNAGQAAAE
jgi:hypothetical protein